MQADRMLECLEAIRWAPPTLALGLGVDAARVERWITGREEIPVRVASWLEALCFTHEASDMMRPALEANEVTPAVAGYTQEHIPTYAYGLLRQINEGPVALRSLFGTDDEAAVFFLVSRGLVERDKTHLTINKAGRSLGEVPASSG